MILSDDGKTLSRVFNSEIKEDGSYEIPQGITAIDNNAFGTCTKLQKISIPNEVTFIGDGAFRDCSKLQRITFPAGITHIGRNAFQGCSQLTQVNIPMGVTSIGDSAFRGCGKLQQVNIPPSVERIGRYAFRGCVNLRQINLPENIAWIGDDAFKGCLPANIFLDVEDKDRERLMSLLPEELKDKVVAYTHNQLVDLWTLQLKRILKTPETNPIYRFFNSATDKVRTTVLPNEMLVHINQYIGENCFYYRKAQKLMNCIELPVRIEERQSYQNKIEAIVSELIEKAESFYRDPKIEQESKFESMGAINYPS
ncbi:leucine-rich repeat domain-containing protein [Fluoribacter gormanii]|uniref:leucine-rich repeat domain-containing protein n=1 Tax=Fluoribacter gormanii TaxID=464 RepID=UPI0010413A69|nr:leucine-rich repeat domain-containing protein [Fluoribacter gormanii]